MAINLNYQNSDRERLDWLQKQLDKKTYTGKVLFRQSTTGRGWRFHETSWEGAVSNVRQALDEAMSKDKG
jgi:hypothetical protein